MSCTPSGKYLHLDKSWYRHSPRFYMSGLVWFAVHAGLVWLISGLFRSTLIKWVILMITWPDNVEELTFLIFRNPLHDHQIDWSENTTLEWLEFLELLIFSRIVDTNDWNVTLTTAIASTQIWVKLFCYRLSDCWLRHTLNSIFF